MKRSRLEEISKWQLSVKIKIQQWRYVSKTKSKQCTVWGFKISASKLKSLLLKAMPKYAYFLRPALLLSLPLPDLVPPSTLAAATPAALARSRSTEKQEAIRRIVGFIYKSEKKFWISVQTRISERLSAILAKEQNQWINTPSKLIIKFLQTVIKLLNVCIHLRHNYRYHCKHQNALLLHTKSVQCPDCIALIAECQYPIASRIQSKSFYIILTSVKG